MNDKNLDILIDEKQAISYNSIKLPQNFIIVGDVQNDDIKVFIKQDVYKQIEQFAESDTTKELGSILIGSYCTTMGEINVVISSYIEAKYTTATAATLTFTHGTWGYIHSKKNELYENEKIIGWQHTHPSYGIFLSSYDLFIHENFFNLDFQIAYVVDPIAKTKGFFGWKNNKIKRLNGFYIYDDKPIEMDI